MEFFLQFLSIVAELLSVLRAAYEYHTAKLQSTSGAKHLRRGRKRREKHEKY